MADEEVKQILLKYQKQESEINERLQQTAAATKNGIYGSSGSERTCPSLDDAIKRNRAILKDLETVKGTLRSKAIYSPSEMQFEAICQHYQTAPALQPNSWKCHVSVYV